MRDHFDYLIVGAGFAGAVIAERLANAKGKKCLLIDRRTHIGGNSYDEYDSSGLLIHRYGPHYFRTDSDAVINYLSNFTEWHPVDYRILSWTDGEFWQFPINLNTFEKLIDHSSTSEEMRLTLEQWKVPIDTPANSEEFILSQVGHKLYEQFFKNYTRKQWNRSPTELNASVASRIPIRTNRDDRYLSEKFQALPKKGFSSLFDNLIESNSIEVRLNTDYKDVQNTDSYDHLIYTGAIDEYYEYCFGELPYRSLRFEPEIIGKEFYQPVMQVNYPNEYEFTRIVEIKHATGQKHPSTTIVREYPIDYERGMERYYPVPIADAQALYKRYASLAASETRVTFTGRLGTYRYINMDQVIDEALKLVDTIEQ